MTTEKRTAAPKLKKKVSMGVTVKRADGTVEDLGIQHQVIKEFTQEELAELIGAEEAAEAFRGVSEGE